MPSPSNPTKGTSNAKVALGLILGFVALYEFCGILNRNKSTQIVTPTGIKIENTLTDNLELQERVRLSSPQENLETGKRLLQNNPTAEQASQATTHLEAVPFNAPEYKEARRLFQKSQAVVNLYRQRNKQEVKRQKQILLAQAAKEALRIKRTRPKRRSSIYHWGPRGGCFYINGSGNKTYVEHSLCR